MNMKHFSQRKNVPLPLDSLQIPNGLQPLIEPSGLGGEISATNDLSCDRAR